jgi:hypothetical protein
MFRGEGHAPKKATAKSGWPVSEANSFYYLILSDPKDRI